MSKLAEFREAERKLQEQLALLEKLKSDSSLKQELEFKDKLQALMDKYGMTLHNIIAILDPKAPVTVSAAPQRRARALKVYKNPNNGEVVETKGGNPTGYFRSLLARSILRLRFASAPDLLRRQVVLHPRQVLQQTLVISLFPRQQEGAVVIQLVAGLGDEVNRHPALRRALVVEYALVVVLVVGESGKRE